MIVLIETLATVAAAWFAGGALYASVVEHPARVQAGRAVALAEFAASYPRGARWQGSLAAFGLLCGLAAFAATGHPAWGAGAVILGAAIPWTLVMMAPVNLRLMAGPGTPDGEAERLLSRWGRLHAVRSVLGIVALLVYLGQLGR